MDEIEEWTWIREFPDYEVSSFGNIRRTGTYRTMRISYTRQGNAKINLSNHDGRFTRSVALLVAQAFVECPDYLSDTPVLLNGDLSDLRASNIVWRPRWFGWKYTRQLKEEVPQHYTSLRVLNLNTGIEYENIVAAGMTEGLLFLDIWRSTYTSRGVYPHQHRFEIDERV